MAHEALVPGHLWLAEGGALRCRTPRRLFVLPSTLALWAPFTEPCRAEGLGGARVSSVPLALESAAAHGGAAGCRVVRAGPLLLELAAALDAPAARLATRRLRLAAALLREELHASDDLDVGIALPRTAGLRAVCDTLLQGGDLTLPALASALGMGSRSLARRFRQELGTPFGQWCTQVRLARAVELWAEGQNVGASAAAVGYSSPSAFSFMVRRQVGMTPRSFLAGRYSPTTGQRRPSQRRSAEG